MDENDFEIPCYAACPESMDKMIRDAVNHALKSLEDNHWKNADEFLNPWGSIEFTLVHLAAYCGKIDVLQQAVTLYANSSVTNKVGTNGKNADPFLATDKFGRSPLHYAASQGHGDVISWLIGQIGTEYFTHLQLSLRDSSGKTPLHEATMELHSDVVKLLVEYGADVNARDNEWTRPFLLAHCNVDPNDPDKMSRYENIVDIFTGARADINSADPKSGFTMLHHTVFLESYGVTKKLLDHGADPSCQSLDRWAVTPIHVAAKIGNQELLCILLKKLTNGLPRTQWPSIIDIPNKDKPSALQVAARYSNFECARTLIDMGANLARRDPYSTTGGTVMDSFYTLTDDLDVADFLENLLDTKIRRTDRHSSDSLSTHIGSSMLDDHDEMNATLDYKVLAPESEPQMAVVTDLIRSLRLPTLRPILTHPLLRAYLAEKWLRVRKVFYTLEVFYVLFVLYISFYALDIRGILNGGSENKIMGGEINKNHTVGSENKTTEKTQKITDTVRLSVMLIFFACVPLCYNLLQFLAELRWYFKRLENWLSFMSLTISVVVALGGIFFDALSTSWFPLLLSAAVVLAWLRLTVFLCRSFGWGYYLTLFHVSLKYAGQIFFITVCLLVGVVVGINAAPMLEGLDTFVFVLANVDNNCRLENVRANLGISIISWLVFFVPSLTGFFLTHSLIHRTTSNERDAVKEIHVERLVKNAEFLADCERITAGWIFRRLWVPMRLTKAPKMTINTSRVVNKSVARHSGISTELWKDIYLLSVKKTEDSVAAIRLLDEKYGYRTTKIAHV